MTATAGVGPSGLEFDGSIDSTDEVGATGEVGSEEYAAKILRIMLWMMETAFDNSLTRTCSSYSVEFNIIGISLTSMARVNQCNIVP